VRGHKVIDIIERNHRLFFLILMRLEVHLIRAVDHCTVIILCIRVLSDIRIVLLPFCNVFLMLADIRGNIRRPLIIRLWDGLIWDVRFILWDRVLVIFRDGLGNERPSPRPEIVIRGFKVHMLRSGATVEVYH
jgi:hypothetical protein